MNNTVKESDHVIINQRKSFKSCGGSLKKIKVILLTGLTLNDVIIICLLPRRGEALFEKPFLGKERGGEDNGMMINGFTCHRHFFFPGESEYLKASFGSTFRMYTKVQIFEKRHPRSGEQLLTRVRLKESSPAYNSQFSGA